MGAFDKTKNALAKEQQGAACTHLASGLSPRQSVSMAMHTRPEILVYAHTFVSFSRPCSEAKRATTSSVSADRASTSPGTSDSRWPVPLGRSSDSGNA